MIYRGLHEWTQDQERFTLSGVAADRQELMVLQRSMQLATHHRPDSHTSCSEYERRFRLTGLVAGSDVADDIR